MRTLQDLEPEYLLAGRDPSLTRGYRSQFRYACERFYAYSHRINTTGPDPIDYIEYAKRNLEMNADCGPIDALGNAKRAVHLMTDALFRLWALNRGYARMGFPVKADLLSDLGAFPTRLVRSLNAQRNLMEHEYTPVDASEAADFVDVAELFIRVSLPHAFHATTAAYVGLFNDHACYEWRLNHKDSTAERWQVESDSYVESDLGPVHFNLSSQNHRTLIEAIPLRPAERNRWIPVLSLLAHLSLKAICCRPFKHYEPDDEPFGIIETSAIWASIQECEVPSKEADPSPALDQSHNAIGHSDAPEDTSGPGK